MTPWLIALIAGAALLIAGGWYFSHIILYPKTWEVQATYDYVVENGQLDPARWKAWPKEEVRIQSPHGYPLFGIYLPQSEAPAAKKTVIIVHGITFTLYGSVKYVEMFYRRGFNVLLIDQRHHGRSGGPNTTFGFQEKYDLQAWMDWALERSGEDCRVGTHGESLGAATALQHASIDPRVAFVIADCPYASAFDEFAYRFRADYRLPPFPLIHIANLISKARAGFDFKAAAPIATISEVTTPIFFIHGADDAYIPPAASRALYEAKRRGLRKIWLAPNANHAESLLKNPADYDRRVGEFLAEIKM
ncbi:MAG: alpha/beta hydrolase [Anaerolineales bacterium]